jgi:hypothetical protein
MPEFDQLVTELRAAVRRYRPNWTDSGAGDPGIALLDLFAFLAEELVYRADQFPDRSRPHLAHLMSRLTRLEALMGPSTPQACPGPKRVRYFSGRLLSADDFTAEQDYFRGKQKTLNRLLLGHGVVSGLETAVEGGTVTVSPGLALDPRGNEITVGCAIVLKLPGGGKPVLLSLEYLERETDPVPGGDGMQASRIEEGFGLTFGSVPPPGAVPLAKLTRRSGRWQLSRDFRVPRITCAVPAARHRAHHAP